MSWKIELLGAGMLDSVAGFRNQATVENFNAFAEASKRYFDLLRGQLSAMPPGARVFAESYVFGDVHSKALHDEEVTDIQIKESSAEGLFDISILVTTKEVQNSGANLLRINYQSVSAWQIIDSRDSLLICTNEIMLAGNGIQHTIHLFGDPPIKILCADLDAELVSRQ